MKYKKIQSIFKEIKEEYRNFDPTINNDSKHKEQIINGLGKFIKVEKVFKNDQGTFIGEILIGKVNNVTTETVRLDHSVDISITNDNFWIESCKEGVETINLKDLFCDTVLKVDIVEKKERDKIYSEAIKKLEED